MTVYSVASCDVAAWLLSEPSLRDSLAYWVHRTHTKDSAATMQARAFELASIDRTPFGQPITKASIRKAMTEL